jgi:Cu-Zn family superoxide dismutase
MKHLVFSLIIVTMALFTGSNYYYYSPFYHSIKKATAIIHPTKGNKATGVVYFSQEPDGLHIKAQISGLTPGKHGFHIHEFGDCACDDAVCAGDHFNPTKQPHGGPQSHKRHVGDFGNLEADENGIAHYEAIDQLAKLNGPHSIIGRGVIVHIQEDDLISQPTGNAGVRVGCGVVGIAKDA